MTLVRNLKGASIDDDLARAYSALAIEFLRHRGGKGFEISETDSCLIDAAVCATESPIDLRGIRKQCDLIENDEERPVEIFNNLGHMFVLLQAIPILSKLHQLVPLFCSPTQQADHEGTRIADLEGETWSLEAYGGGDIKNNGKLAKDLRTLEACSRRGHRTFLAFRSNSLPIVKKWNRCEHYKLRQTCSPSHGGPFTSSCLAQLQDQLNNVTLIEVSQILITTN
ncbi:MAG: hypothetical protein U0894_08975 [Pirellulales bacterium]